MSRRKDKAGKARDPIGSAPIEQDVAVRLEIVIGATDARRLLRLATAAGLSAEACAASLVAEVLADDAAAHALEGATSAGEDAWDWSAFPDPPAGGWLQ